MNTQLYENIHTIWNYQIMHHELQKADCMLALGSHDLRVAERAADVYLEGWADKIVFSGGLGRLTEGYFKRSEAELFAAVAIDKGVPEEAVLIEPSSTNTGENFRFTGQLLKDHHLAYTSFIVVQKPYMERRAYATFKKHWPEKQCVITSPQLSFEAYCQSSNPEINQEAVINLMVGDLQRVKLYGERGFQIPQEIPGNVWEAYQALVAAGYTKHLIAD